MTKETYRRKCLLWGSQFKRIRVHDRDGREHGDSQVGMALEQIAGGFHLSS